MMRTTALAMLLAPALLVSQAAAEQLYTIDLALDELLVIESTTGQIVRDVGWLVPTLDILSIRALGTRFGGQLYGIFEVYASHDAVYEISRTTGRAQVRNWLPGVRIVEGLACDPIGWWWVSYSNVALVSDHLGRFQYDPGDAILDQGPLRTAAGDPIDGDELRFAHDGTLYLVDALCCGNGTNFYSIYGTTGTLLAHCEEYSYISSADFDYADRLVFMDEVADVIGIVSLADGSVSNVVPLPNPALTGLARTGAGPVEAAATSWGSVKARHR